MYKYCLEIAFLVLLLNVTPAALLAQGTSTINGRVTGANASPIAGAIVTATNPSNFTSISAVTNAAGSFELNYLAAGRYSVSVQAKGHAGASVGSFQLELRETRSLNIRMDGGGPTPVPTEVSPVQPATKIDLPKVVLQDLTREINQVFQSRKEPELTASLQRLFARYKSAPNSYSSAAENFYRNNEYERALKIYDLGAKAEKSNVPTFQRRSAEILLEIGSFEDAAKLVQALLKADPGNVDTLALDSALKLYSGSPDERAKAIANLEMQLLKTPGDCKIHFNLARALDLQGKTESAGKHYLAAINLRPDYMPARIGIAQFYLSRREWTDALSAGSKVLAISHNNITARLIRCTALVASRQFKQARQEIDDVFKLDPGSMEARFQSGYIDLQEMKLDEAEKSFLQVRVAAPSDIRAIVGLAEVVLARGDPHGAVAFLKREMAANPQQTNLLISLGGLATKAKLGDEAIAAYSQLLTKEPENSAVHARLGILLNNKNDSTNSLVHLRRAVELSPNDPATALALALLYEKMGKPNAAVPIYEKILELNPDDLNALNNLAYRLVEDGKDLNRGLQLAARALQLKPADPDIEDTMALAYIKKSQHPGAIEILIDIIRRNPDHPNLAVFQYHLGMAYAGAGNHVAARRALDAALSANPSPDDKKAIQALLAKL